MNNIILKIQLIISIIKMIGHFYKECGLMINITINLHAIKPILAMAQFFFTSVENTLARSDRIDFSLLWLEHLMGLFSMLLNTDFMANLSHFKIWVLQILDIYLLNKLYQILLDSLKLLTSSLQIGLLLLLEVVILELYLLGSDKDILNWQLLHGHHLV